MRIGCEGLLKLKKICESCHSEDGANIIGNTSDINVAAFWLGILQDAEEDTQTTRRDILQLCTVEDNIMTFAIL